MATIIAHFSMRVNGALFPVVFLRDFGGYRPELVEEATAALDWASSRYPEADKSQGKVLVLCFFVEDGKVPERMPLPNGGDLVFCDFRQPGLPGAMQAYAQCMDIGQQQLRAGHTPEYAAAAAWEFAQTNEHLADCTKRHGAFAQMVESMRDMQEAINRENANMV